jgi:hypothetical protein
LSYRFGFQRTITHCITERRSGAITQKFAPICSEISGIAAKNRSKNNHVDNRDSRESQLDSTAYNRSKSLKNKGNGAGEGNRTLDNQLGKLMFYH